MEQNPSNHARDINRCLPISSEISNPQGLQPDSPERPKDSVSSSDEDFRQLKADNILRACNMHDVIALRELAASSGGFLTDELRQQAWPLLMGCRGNTASSGSPPVIDASPDWRSLPIHKDEDQVQLDVNRSFIFYPLNARETELAARKVELSNLIVQTLRRYPMLCYFQGYHDIIQVLLLVLGEKQSAELAVHLSLLRIRDFMLPSMAPSLAHLELVPPILYAADRALFLHLSHIKPFFALAATLTLYAHEIQDYGEIARLFDFLLAHEAAVGLYFFAVTIMSRRKELLEIPVEDADILEATLRKLPQPLDVDSLIVRTIELFEKHPPETLPFRAWSKISSNSVLKTTRRVDARISRNQLGGTVNILPDGEALFARQVRELRRKERLQKMIGLLKTHRRFIVGATLTFAIGALAIWLRKQEESSSLGLLGWVGMRLNIVP